MDITLHCEIAPSCENVGTLIFPFNLTLILASQLREGRSNYPLRWCRQERLALTTCCAQAPPNERPHPLSGTCLEGPVSEQTSATSHSFDERFLDSRRAALRNWVPAPFIAFSLALRTVILLHIVLNPFSLSVVAGAGISSLPATDG